MSGKDRGKAMRVGLKAIPVVAVGLALLLWAGAAPAGRQCAGSSPLGAPPIVATAFLSTTHAITLAGC